MSLLDIALANQAAGWTMTTRQPTEMTVAEAKAAGLLGKPKRNKFNNRRTECNNGHVHHSALEAKRCDQLHLMEKAGQIRNLSVQPSFELIPEFNHGAEYLTTERKTMFVPDFLYEESSRPGRWYTVVEDVKAPPHRDKHTGRLKKPTQTGEFEVKRKLFLSRRRDLDFRILTKEDIG